MTVSVFRDGTVIGNAYFQLQFKAENNPLSWLLTLPLMALAIKQLASYHGRLTKLMNVYIARALK